MWGLPKVALRARRFAARSNAIFDVMFDGYDDVADHEAADLRPIQQVKQLAEG
jgi:hypothetical protein